MKSALDVHRDLLAKGVPHEVVQLPRLITTAEDLPEALGVDACASVRCYVIGSSLAAVVVLAGTAPHPALLQDLLGEHRQATGAEVNTGTDYAFGLVSPVCLPASVAVFADSALGRYDVLYTAAGEGGLALGIRTHDLLVACDARVATLTPPPPDGEDLIEASHRMSFVRRTTG